jgi:hypothetical protein
MSWSDQEQLVIVLEDGRLFFLISSSLNFAIGNALLYDIHGKLVCNFLLLDAVTKVHILECHFWGNGVVAISSDMTLYVYEVSFKKDENLCCAHFFSFRGSQV